MAIETATITAADQRTSWLSLGARPENFFTASVRGTFVATLTVEAKRPGEPDANAIPVREYTSPIVERGTFPGPWLVRVGCNTGNYTSGTAQVTVYDDNS